MTFKKTLWAFWIAFLIAVPALVAENYPLTITGVFTNGNSALLYRGQMYHSGDYDCTRGDENNAPECHTVSEWAQLESLAGTPSTVVFTLADGSQVGVQSEAVNKIPGFIECGAGTPIIFCELYFEFLGRQQVNRMRKSQYGQTEFMSAEEYEATSEARRRELFGNGNTMTLTFRYRLNGDTVDGFQRIEVDKSSCNTDEHKVNHCEGGHVLHVLNSRGDGYLVGQRVTAVPSQISEMKGSSEIGSSSPADAAALAESRPLDPERASLVSQGQASRCAVVSTPSGAEVYIDGRKVGATPFAFILLKRDAPRTITVKLDGYQTFEKQYVPDGRTISIAVQLQKNQ
ncbi:MAG: PEGA domain-containing protein [Acidobacteriia bacterium]|nr:PEGA domain-containing protein [Terriglobia bacterium]